MQHKKKTKKTKHKKQKKKNVHKFTKIDALRIYNKAGYAFRTQAEKYSPKKVSFNGRSITAGFSSDWTRDELIKYCGDKGRINVVTIGGTRGFGTTHAGYIVVRHGNMCVCTKHNYGDSNTRCQVGFDAKNCKITVGGTLWNKNRPHLTAPTSAPVAIP